jgi:hypothetical protein
VKFCTNTIAPVTGVLVLSVVLLPEESSLVYSVALVIASSWLGNMVSSLLQAEENIRKTITKANDNLKEPILENRVFMRMNLSGCLYNPFSIHLFYRYDSFR